jgi:hypothetical protein
MAYILQFGDRAALFFHPALLFTPAWKPALPRGLEKWPSAQLPTAAWPADLGHEAPSLQG